MNRFIIGVLLLSLPAVASSQWSFSPEIGYGSYNLKGIRFVSESQVLPMMFDISINSTDRYAELQLLDNFPPYVNYGISICYARDNDRVSRIGYTFLTTGARYYYEDYSGYAALDYNANAHAFSYTFAMPITRKLEQLHWYINPALLLGKYKRHTEYDVAGEIEYSYGSIIGYTINFGGTAGLEYVWQLKDISITTRAGYYMDLYSGKIQNGGWFDFDNPYSYKKLVWRGIRGTVALNIPFSIFYRD